MNQQPNGHQTWPPFCNVCNIHRPAQMPIMPKSGQVSYNQPSPLVNPRVEQFFLSLPNIEKKQLPIKTQEQIKQEVAKGIEKLKKYNILDGKLQNTLNRIGKKKFVEGPCYKSRRLQLLAENKPVADYKPYILDRWTREDYIIHNRRRLAQGVKNDYEYSDPEIAEIRLIMHPRVITVQTLKVDILKKDIKPFQTTDRWWMVVDTKVLLDDMWFIERLLKTDSFCRIWLPYETLHDLSQMTMKSRPVWMRAPARRVVQLLEHKSGICKMIKQQGAIENEDLIDNHLAKDAVLNCCMQMLRCCYFVVLVTDDEKRREKAKEIDLPSYSLQELKEITTLGYSNLQMGHITVSIERSSIS